MNGAARRHRPRGWTVRRRLILIVLLVAVPMLLLSAGIVWRLAEHERDISRQALMYSARSIASALDARLGRYEAVVRTLAASPSLQRHDLAAFREEAERALPALSGAWVLVADAHGGQLLNTLVPAGEPLPALVPEAMADRAFATRQVQFSNVAFAPLAKVMAVAVGMPVFRGGEPDYYVLIVTDVASFRDLLNHGGMPAGWLAGIIDRQGNFIARSVDDARFVGQPAAAGWRAVMRQNVVFDITSREGRQLIDANVVSPLSGWAVAVGAEKSVLETPLRRATIMAILVGLAVTLTSILLAALVARRITAAIGTLEKTADAIRHHRSVDFAATGMPEFDHVLEAFDAASIALIANERALRMSEQRLRLLLDGTVDYAVFMLDADGRIRTWNEGARRIKGYEAGDVIGQHFSMFYASRQQADNELQLALRTGGFEKECEHVRKDGSRFLANVMTAPLFDDKGFLRGYSRLARDVTTRKHADEALRSQAALLDLSRDAIIFRGRNDEITYWSRGAERIYGWRGEEVKGAVSHDLFKTQFPKPLPEILAEVEATGHWDGELVHTRKDGGEIAVFSRWVLQRSRSGHRVGVLEVNRNRT